MIRYRVSEQGAVMRGNERFSHAGFEDVLAASGEISVMPVVLVEFDGDTPCSQVVAIRNLLSEAEICHEGHCVEGGLPSGWHAMSGS